MSQVSPGWYPDPSGRRPAVSTAPDGPSTSRAPGQRGVDNPGAPGPSSPSEAPASRLRRRRLRPGRPGGQGGQGYGQGGQAGQPGYGGEASSGEGWPARFGSQAGRRRAARRATASRRGRRGRRGSRASTASSRGSTAPQRPGLRPAAGPVARRGPGGLASSRASTASSRGSTARRAARATASPATASRATASQYGGYATPSSGRITPTIGLIGGRRRAAGAAVAVRARLPVGGGQSINLGDVSDLSDFGVDVPVAIDTYASLPLPGGAGHRLRHPRHPRLPQIPFLANLSNLPIIAAAVLGVFAVARAGHVHQLRGADVSPAFGAILGLIGWGGLIAGQFLTQPVGGKR